MVGLNKFAFYVAKYMNLLSDKRVTQFSVREKSPKCTLGKSFGHWMDLLGKIYPTPRLEKKVNLNCKTKLNQTPRETFFSQKGPRLQRPFYSFYRSKPLLLNKAQFRSLNIKVQNVDYIVFSGEYNL